MTGFRSDNRGTKETGGLHCDKRHALNRTIETGLLVELQTRVPKRTESGLEVGLHR